MKLLLLLCIVFLCTACLPQDLPTFEPSPTLIDSQPFNATIEPAATPVSHIPTKEPTLSPTHIPIFNIVIDNVAISPSGQIFASGFNQGDNLRHFARWDGANWIELGNGFSTAGNSLVIDSAGNLYTEILTDSEQCMAIMKWDGSSWKNITANLSNVVDALKSGRVSCNVPVVALAVDVQDNLYAAGTFYYPSVDFRDELPLGYVVGWNKQTWTVLGQGFEMANIYGMVVSATGKVYVSGEHLKTAEDSTIGSLIAGWDGEKWNGIERSHLSPCLSTTHLAVDSSEGLYANCKGSEPGESLSYWDGLDWRTITNQLVGEAPAIYDMALDKNGRLCIGGSFESVGGIPARYVACWDGSKWNALGDGVNERVNALAFDSSGELYAVGFFTQAGGEAVEHVASWDGENWLALGP